MVANSEKRENEVLRSGSMLMRATNCVGFYQKLKDQSGTQHKKTLKGNLTVLDDFSASIYRTGKSLIKVAYQTRRFPT